MPIVRSATAGTEQANDILVTLEPALAGEGIRIALESPVAVQFGQAIEQTIRATLAAQGIADVTVAARDQGALDFTIRARILAALARAGVTLAPGRP